MMNNEETSQICHEMAYYAWLDAGRPQNKELDYWLEAEQKLKQIRDENDGIAYCIPTNHYGDIGELWQNKFNE